MEDIDFALRVVVFFAPYLLAIGAGGYLEAKYGQKALAALHTDLAAAKAELATLKAKL